MKRKALFPFLAVLLLSLPQFSHAENWPAWRGASGLGLTSETNLPTQWNDIENVKWKTPLSGPGNSTPVIWENKIFLTQFIGKQGRRALLCYDRTNGKQLWQVSRNYNEAEESHRTNPYCSSSPVTDGQRVIAWFGSAGIFCYTLDGKELWQRDLGKQEHGWGYGASPIIYENLCILHFGPGKRSFLIALDKTTGKTVWQVDLSPKQPAERTDGFAGQSDGEIGSWSTPIIISASGRDELILSVPQAIKAFAPKTGAELWHCDGLNPLIYTSPIYGENVVVAMGGFHGTTLAVHSGGRGDVTAQKLWQTPRTPNRLGSGVIYRGHLYVANTPGIVECLDLPTGKKIWEERLPSKGAKSEIWSSMILAGDKIYLLNQSGDCVILRASPQYEVIAVNSIGGELTNGSLAASHGELFIRTHEHLWCIAQHAKPFTPPIKALFLTGGGHHDYEKLAPHLTQNLGKLLNATFDVRFDLEILQNEKFAADYDVVVYDFCFDAVESTALENAMNATRQGKPAVMIHCAIHAFRQSEKIGDWESCCGMKSKKHDPYQTFSTEKVTQDHPAIRNFPDRWTTPGDELYQTIELLPRSQPLLKAKSPQDGREHVVCWVQHFGQGRVFATTLGHDLKTATAPEYLRLLADGILWATGQR